MGIPTGVSKPKSYVVSGGVWHIVAVSPQQNVVHDSDIALTFTASDGSSYGVRGHVRLPQELF